MNMLSFDLMNKLRGSQYQYYLPLSNIKEIEQQVKLIFLNLMKLEYELMVDKPIKERINIIMNERNGLTKSLNEKMNNPIIRSQFNSIVDSTQEDYYIILERFPNANSKIKQQMMVKNRNLLFTSKKIEELVQKSKNPSYVIKEKFTYDGYEYIGVM